MERKFADGVWPVMLTPFTEDNKVDYTALGELVDWYIENGVDGLFAVCQSSEMFFLSLEERVEVARFVKQRAAGRVQVIASGHVSDSMEEQAREINLIAATGVDAVILITNRLAAADDPDSVWLDNLSKLLEQIDKDIPLGFYECPYPYKRVMSDETVRWCANNGRFYFLKDTSCDIDSISSKLAIIKGSNLKLYNANTSTLLESMQMGAAGYSGVMANFHPSLYTKLCRSYNDSAARKLADELIMMSLIERQLYPVNAKSYLQRQGLHISTLCRNKNRDEFTTTFAGEVKALERITKRISAELHAG